MLWAAIGGLVGASVLTGSALYSLIAIGVGFAGALGYVFD